MREIKFRGKHIHVFIEPNNTGIWVYGYLCNDHYINSEELMGEMFVDKNTVGQFTGLKDVNGTEIYEGDIVKVEKNDLAKIIYNEDRMTFGIEPINEFYFDSPLLADNSELDFEVIGNIYDNPELLEKE